MPPPQNPEVRASQTSLRISREGKILLIQLDDPSGLPRLSRDLLRELSGALDQAQRDDAVSGIVITGTPQAFAAGAALDEVAQLSGITALEFSRLGQSVMRRIEKMSKPTVAAIQGYCLGGALDLALACRARIATPDARFAHPGAARGIITGWGGTQRLSRLIGAARATDLFLTGRMVSAKEALDCGLICGVYSAGDLLPGAIQLVR